MIEIRRRLGQSGARDDVDTGIDDCWLVDEVAGELRVAFIDAADGAIPSPLFVERDVSESVFHAIAQAIYERDGCRVKRSVLYFPGVKDDSYQGDIRSIGDEEVPDAGGADVRDSQDTKPDRRRKSQSRASGGD